VQGPTGPQGADGAAGDQVIWAVVSSTGSVSRSSGGVTATNPATGSYTVDFNEDITQCAYIAQTGDTGSSTGLFGGVRTRLRAGFTDEVQVNTMGEPSGDDHWDNVGPVNLSFHIAVHC
jgi:hypothetical protein